MRSWVPAATKFMQAIGLPALAGMVAGAAVTTHFESRLETSKEHVSAIIKQKDDVDSSQAQLFAQLGLFISKLFDKDVPITRNDLDSTIIQAEIRLNRLKEDLPPSDQAVLGSYQEELNRLKEHLSKVSGPADLRPIYISAQKLLAIHDDLAERVRRSEQITAF